MESGEHPQKRGSVEALEKGKRERKIRLHWQIFYNAVRLWGDNSVESLLSKASGSRWPRHACWEDNCCEDSNRGKEAPNAPCPGLDMKYLPKRLMAWSLGCSFQMWDSQAVKPGSIMGKKQSLPSFTQNGLWPVNVLQPMEFFGGRQFMEVGNAAQLNFDVAQDKSHRQINMPSCFLAFCSHCACEA